MIAIRKGFLLLFLMALFSFYPSISRAQSLFERWETHRSMEEESLFGHMKWVSLGPSFIGSRVETVEVHPDRPSVIYMGLGSGGLWKTENNGLSWFNIFADEPGFSIGDLAISQSNPEVLWLGTGEQLRASRGYSYPGTGIYRSEDGGKSWTSKGLHNSYQIGRVLIDPFNPDKVFVAVIGAFWSKNEERGLFRTVDGGETWEKILYISDSVGVVDVLWDANNEILYASSWEMPGGSGSAVYRSTDEGQSWTTLDIPFSSKEHVGRIGLAMIPAWPNMLYAIADIRNPAEQGEGELIGAEIFSSHNFGKSWSKTHKEPLSIYGGFGWAFGDIVIHPSNPDEIFVPGITLLHSKNGGASFTKVEGSITHLVENRAETLHLDHHEFKVIPGKQDTWISGNDGGLYISHDLGKHWLHLNNFPTGEFYDVSTYGNHPVVITGGTQDNSNIIGQVDPYDLTGSSTSWEYVWLDPWSGGDGFTCLVDPTDQEWVYWEAQNGHLNKTNIKTRENKYIKPSPDDDEAPMRNSWFTPYFISTFNPTSLYFGANKIYKSINRGESWTRISHDITYSEYPTKKSRSITALAESPLKPGVIYAGTENGAVWVSRSDGNQWFEISKGIPDLKIVNILASRHLTSRVYLVAKGMDEDNLQPYVFQSDNYGADWKPLHSNLPPIPVNCIAEDHKLENLLVAGTDAGVFISRDMGTTWEALSYQLPAASVVQLRWMADDDFLLAATHGLGLFYCHFDPVRKFSQSGYILESKFLSSMPGTLPYEKDYRGDWDLSSIKPLMLSWFSENPGATRIGFINEKGEEVYDTSLMAVKGFNQYQWDLIISKENDHTIYPLPKINFPKAGKYKINITQDKNLISGEVEIFQPSRQRF